MINIKRILKYALYILAFFAVLIFSPFFGLVGAMLLQSTISAVVIALSLYILRAIYIAFKLIRNDQVITTRKIFNLDRRKKRSTHATTQE